MQQARWRSAVVLCLVAVLAAGRPAAAHPLDIIPFDDVSYADLYRLAAAGLAPLWAATVRPLTRLQLARMVARSLDRLVADRAAFSPYSVLTLEQLVLQFADELALLGYRVVQPPGGPSAQTVTGWGVQLNRALVWRVGSGASPSIDGSRLPASGSRRWATDAGDRLRIVKLLGLLSEGAERYLYGMRVDWLATDALRLGVGETVVASGSMYLPYALNPIPLLTYGLDLWIRQQQMGITDNYNIALDFDWRIGRGTTLYGELYVDNLSTGSNAFPSIGAGTAGLFFGNPFQDGRTDLRLEHTRATNWIYSTAGGASDYVYSGRALGHWCAPDCELWSADLSRRFDSGSVLTLGYDLVRKGEGQLGQPLPANPADAWANLDLSGVVGTTQAWRLKYSWMQDPSLQQEIGAGWSSVLNASHLAGQTRADWVVWWEARYEF